jgi:hypothetical protein
MEAAMEHRILSGHLTETDRPRGRALGLRRPAPRSRLDALVGLTLWLTLIPGAAGTGLGVIASQLTL